MEISFGNKRKRENDDDMLPQRKTFVNQRRVNESDEQKMSQIHQKTLQLLFEGAKLMSQKLNLLLPIRLSGNGCIHILPGYETQYQVPLTPELICTECNNMARIKTNCSNCPLDLCEFCGISCNFCDCLLCIRCVKFFDCNINNELACCERCKTFN